MTTYVKSNVSSQLSHTSLQLIILYMWHPEQTSLGWSNNSVTADAGGMYGGLEKCKQNFGKETWRKETTWMAYALVGEYKNLFYGITN